MNVVIISECKKGALKESRRILDQFAERRGERTWQTAITWEGLKTLRRLLRRSARKNTAIACHWIRGTDHSELLWTVGKSRHFDRNGAVPTNTTGRNIIRLADENDWHTGEAIYLLSALAALMHDLGKACSAFQRRLIGKPHHEGANLYRHEWISLRLFQGFVGDGSDEQWLERLMESGGADQQDWFLTLQKDGLDTGVNQPFSKLPPLAAAIGWLIVTHHRLPQKPETEHGLKADQFEQYFQSIGAQWNQFGLSTEVKDIKPYWTFDKGLPVVSKHWQKRAKRLAARLLVLHQQNQTEVWLDNLYVMHVSRLSLMLADHYYSGLESKHERVFLDPHAVLYANTTRSTGRLNQGLDEHLVGVALNAGFITHSLPDLERSLPSLINHKGLRKRSVITRFKWQDKAADLAASIRERSERQGAFIINMASTGCGKTLANARIMYALANPSKGARFSVALGLRTLTLQTGKDYQGRQMYLDEEQLAVRVGGSASRDLFEFYRDKAAQVGSESLQDLIDEDGGVLYEGDYDAHPLLSKTLSKPEVKALVAAPVLVCTVDHLTPATESTRGGRQIAPMLRLMTSDLILDEVDDYGLEDLPALVRLVHWAAMLGGRVMLSSATLPPSMIQGLFEAYRAGREQYQRNRGDFGVALDIPCVWVDENRSVVHDCAVVETFRQHHVEFTHRRFAMLAAEVKKKQYRRISQLISIQDDTDGQGETLDSFAKQVVESALALHANNHSVDKVTGKSVSFGLVRFANIQPLVQIALLLFQQKLPDDFCFHVCVYHSQYPLLMRSAIERELDQTLNRSEPSKVFQLARVKSALNQHAANNHLFIVLGSPVTEVGRDHDYDWAIVEPSAMRSLIQLVGRIRRHRPEPYDEINIHLFRKNIRSYLQKNEPAFTRPGFETKQVRLNQHDLASILQESEWKYIDARPRITERESLLPNESLVDLEHYQLQRLLLPRSRSVGSPRRRSTSTISQVPLLGAHSWWSASKSTLMSILQRHQPFRQEVGDKRRELVLLPNEDEDDFVLHQIERHGFSKNIYIPVEESKLQRLTDNEIEKVNVFPWFTENYMELLIAQAEQEEISLSFCALKYGVLSLRETTKKWCYHPALGFYTDY